MSYDENDAAWDSFAERFARENYPEHRAEAIEEFTHERLRSFYVDHPNVMSPAVMAPQEGKALHTLQHSSAAVVFFASAVELLLKFCRRIRINRPARACRFRVDCRPERGHRAEKWPACTR